MLFRRTIIETTAAGHADRDDRETTDPDQDEPATRRAEQIAAEQLVLDEVVDRRAHLSAELAERSRTATDPAAAAEASRRAREIDAVVDGFVFGRLSGADGGRLHIGRQGVRRSDGDPLVIDWRAPAARPFYTATAADPQGLTSRRHIRTDGATVLSVDDESFVAPSGDLVGEAALVAALDARRTGQMTDIVATLQAEQDAVVRARPGGCLVVQGGPGTGKTAVALHRAAYLLFTHPRIAERGVLILGPSTTFLDYIGQVLPSLGETRVVAATTATLLPGIRASAGEPFAVAEIKGRAIWADVLRRAVAERRPAAADLEIDVAGTTIVIPADRMQRLIDEIEAIAEPQHAQRERYVDGVAELLTAAIRTEADEALEQVEEGLEDVLAVVDRSLAKDQTVAVRRSDLVGADVDGRLSVTDAQSIAEQLVADPEVVVRMERIWPTVDPEAILREVLGSAIALDRLAPDLPDQERAAVAADFGTRRAGSGWSVADVALLDELADLVGAPATLGAGTGTTSIEADTFAARAAQDRTWAFGHVIVDEGQELSAMQWRALRRRCPTLSFTVVGDVNQTSSPGGTTSWADALDDGFGDRWRQVDLTVCYRTPREVMELTPPVLRRAGSSIAPPQAVRGNGLAPIRRTAEPETIDAVAREQAVELAAAYDGGSVAIVWPDGHPLAAPRRTPGSAEIVEIGAAQAKGLEFDAVVVADPDAIVAADRGWNALYVAMTRCTQQLAMVASPDGPVERAVPLSPATTGGR